MLLCMRTTVRLDDTLLRQAKTHAVEHGQTLTALIEEGLRLALSQPANRPTATRTLPISGKKGGTLPGIDLARTTDLEKPVAPA
jgi:hypothetical protein